MILRNLSSDAQWFLTWYFSLSLRGKAALVSILAADLSRSAFSLLKNSWVFLGGAGLQSLCRELGCHHFISKHAYNLWIAWHHFSRMTSASWLVPYLLTAAAAAFSVACWCSLFFIKFYVLVSYLFRRFFTVWNRVALFTSWAETEKAVVFKGSFIASFRQFALIGNYMCITYIALVAGVCLLALNAYVHCRLSGLFNFNHIWDQTPRT